MVFGTVLNLATTLSLSCIQHPNQCANGTTSSYPPPVIQYGHQNQTLMLNDHAILPCQGTGRKPIKIKWLKDSQEIDVNANQYKGRYRQLAVGTLQISELKREDTGVYTCIARNEDGEATWTASLVVEEHTNQNTVFQRMPDAAALPSPPGQPIVSNITEDSIELEWTIPERQGASQILGYLIQYWTPDERESWQNIHDVIPNNRFRVKNLRPGQSYFFLVRAENSKGIGLPSATSEMATTKFSNGKREDHRMGRMLDVESARQRLSSEQLIKLLEVRALNATAMLLSWKRQRKEPLIEGYYIKWRGPPLAQDHSWVNVTDPDVDHVIINGLRPFNNYEFFVIPYHQQVQGMPSNSLDGITAEAAPTMQPSDVRLRMLNISSLRVSWRPPPADHINGILKGFLINIRSNHSSVEDRNITTNERATSVTLYRLIPNASYAIKVAARTSAGVGVFYIGEPVIMNEETLRHHIRIFERSNNDWYKQPWAVLGFGIVLWCFLLLFVVLLWYRCCHHNRAENKEKKEREFIKIRDGSVPNNTMFGEARNAFWADQNGGTVETFSGTIARPGQHMDHRIDYSTEYGTNCCNRDMVGGSGLVPHNLCRLHCSQTLQEINGDCAQHSPSQHYHYAQLPQEYFGANEQGPVSTFKRRPPQYYDDPSPYATTTLVNPAGIASIQVVHAHQEPRLPSILSNPPKQPPSHFLSSRAVIRNSGTNNSRFDQQNSNSCSALVEISPECITAMTLQQSKNKNRAQQQQQQFCTTGRSTRNKGTKSGRSSSVTATNSRQISNANGCYQQQESSPSTDITSDGSSMNRRNGHSLTLMAEAPEYDPVMTESIHQQIVSIRKRKGREQRSSRPNARNRVSLIEDEERVEQDPLMRRNASGREKEADLEADGEMSDEYISSGREAVTQEHCLSPVPYRPGQPMMGVNISTLSGDNFMSGRLTKTTTPNN